MTEGQKIEILIKKLENVARLTERKTFPESDERTLNNAAWFKDMTDYQQGGALDVIYKFQEKTKIDLKYWMDETKENHHDLMIKF